MESNALMMVIELIIIITSFFIGRYILPKYKNNIQDAALQFEVLLNYAESYVAYAKQFLNIPNSEKMDVVVEKLRIICESQGIEIDEETLRAIGQKAYNTMKSAETNVLISVEELDCITEELDLSDIGIKEPESIESKITDTNDIEKYTEKLSTDNIVLL